ncbi:hypothetical protein ACET3Z_026216 [Daucus carota]
MSLSDGSVRICQRCFSVTVWGVRYHVLSLPDEVVEEMDFETHLEVQFLTMNCYLHEERLREEAEARRLAAIRHREWIIRFAGMMSSILHKQEEEEKKAEEESSS